MDPAMEQVIAAVSAQYEPTSTHEQRAAAFKFCADFEANADVALPVALRLVALGAAVDVRVLHYGLRIVSRVVTLNWNQLDEARKQFLKDAASNLLATPAAVLQQHALVQEAIVRVVGEVATREWPQRWPSLVDQLFAAAATSQAHTQLTLLVFRNLCEEVLDFQPQLPPQRRRELQAGLAAPTLMGRLFPVAAGLLAAQAAALAASGDGGDAAMARALVNTCLQLFQALLPWVRARHIFECQAFLPAVVACLSSGDVPLVEEAADCLALVCARSLKSIDAAHHAQMQSVWQTAVQFGTAAVNAPFMTRKTDVLQKVLRMIGPLVSGRRVNPCVPGRCNPTLTPSYTHTLR
jgi:hypothetical protein